MSLSGRISIRSKILLLLSSLVVAAVALYLYLASKIFYEDKTLLIYELNQTNVRALGAEVEVRIRRIMDQLRMIATAPELVDVIVSDGKENAFIRVGWLEDAEGQIEGVSNIKVWESPLKIYSRAAVEILKALDSALIPIEEVRSKGSWVRNSTLGGSETVPIMTVALVVPGKNRVIFADTRLDPFLKAFAAQGIAEMYLVDSGGNMLAHHDAARVMSAENASNDYLVQIARKSKIRSEVKKFEEGDRSFLGSYYQLGVAGLVVASRVELKEAFVAMRVLLKKSLQYAAIVVTAAFLAALFFSHSLTSPIGRLVEATQRVAHGDFSQKVDISTGDEISVLANSFNSMTADLRISREKIEEYSRDLEKKVQDRTIQLEKQNIAIKEAQEALVRTTRLASVGEIAGRAAHEVLNPLTSIQARLEKIKNSQNSPEKQDIQLFGEIVGAWKGDLDKNGPDGLMQALVKPSTATPGKTLLQEDLENLQAISVDWGTRMSSQEEDLKFLMREVNRIEKIVNGMRQLSRAGGDRKSLNVHHFLNEVFATMNDILGKHGIQTEQRYGQKQHEQSDWEISADHDELLQVFSNLLRNSMQALDEAKRDGKPLGQPPKIWIQTELTQISQISWVWIRVCDNGPGIEQQNFHRIFEPTFTTKKADEGTGLGLSICRRFIRSWEGEITVEKSIPGVETVFLIELPLVEGQRNG